MPSDNQRESGARAPKEKGRRDANEEVSQKAAENRKPPSGTGLTEPLSQRSETDKSDLTDSRPRRPDGAGQGG